MGDAADNLREQEEDTKLLLALHKIGKCGDIDSYCMFCLEQFEDSFD